MVGSYAYNATMTLGASAVARPLCITRPGQLHAPLVIMLLALVGVLAMAWRRGQLMQPAGVVLLACCPAFVVVALTVR